ncbi:conserved protein of unknown function, contains HNH endonuclease domain [Nitrospira defluvii]|jgi:hypothetical protein|uniref:HNH nuclease domain-containing protein n=1 Tax=Nitrospira defluvii TaxID=330214 RepID=D8PGD6_9BACT|nr:conserved protein of unknown function, contains HNH endonuclease domain [Nitrospira defluvii]
MSDVEDKEKLTIVAQDILRPLPVKLRGLANVRTEVKLKESYTKGWRVELGALKHRNVRLEVWFCQYPKEGQRFFWYGFYAAQAENLRAFIDCLPETLRPVKQFSDLDLRLANGSRQDYVMKRSLQKEYFNHPIYEEYRESGQRYSYFGHFDSSLSENSNALAAIVGRALSFFEEVLASLRTTPAAVDLGAPDESDVYTGIERRVVKLHLSRERSRDLAERCKRRDNYRCRVCEMTFREVYGDIGRTFAEAHHVIPLSRLSSTVESSIEDLITVCSNCHQMLHRLDGEAGDVPKLRRMIHRP